MAKNDYFAVAYRILAYLYACLKEGAKPDYCVLSPQEIGINESYWTFVMTELHDHGYIRGSGFTPILGGKLPVRIDSLCITQEGIEFMQENSAMSKARDFLKSLKEIIPGI